MVEKDLVVVILVKHLVVVKEGVEKLVESEQVRWVWHLGSGIRGSGIGVRTYDIPTFHRNKLPDLLEKIL